MSELLVENARAGSRRAFDELVGPNRRELHVHCYRMLGSFEDAEDAVQETLLRAWSRIETYAGTSTFRAWLYAIATNACLDVLRRRKGGQWPTVLTGAVDPRDASMSPADVPWLGPYPDVRLVGASEESAEDAVIRKEGIELAFLTAIQRLPPRQRAVLILRDVLAWSAKETAATLGITPAAVNSALQRAHASMKAPGLDRPRVSARDERAVLDRFMAAWDSADLRALAELLAADARFAMPPMPVWFEGRDDILTFAASRFDLHRLAGREWRSVPTAANGQPAFALYLGSGDRHLPFALGVLRVGPDGIEEVSLFMDGLARFELFDLPDVV